MKTRSDCLESIRFHNSSLGPDSVNLPKTRVSRASVPVILSLAVIFEEYRGAMGYPRTGAIFHEPDGLPNNLDSFTRKAIQPVLQPPPHILVRMARVSLQPRHEPVRNGRPGYFASTHLASRKSPRDQRLLHRGFRRYGILRDAEVPGAVRATRGRHARKSAAGVRICRVH